MEPLGSRVLSPRRRSALTLQTWQLAPGPCLRNPMLPTCTVHVNELGCWVPILNPSKPTSTTSTASLGYNRARLVQRRPTSGAQVPVPLQTTPVPNEPSAVRTSHLLPATLSIIIIIIIIFASDPVPNNVPNVIITGARQTERAAKLHSNT
ncbi:hypothetical protein BGW80DRAFT_734574 [Lactifluus volemus]|nr:hypothetical protein BGW80DRAFT_734574 [Lactifluus volemus]